MVDDHHMMRLGLKALSQAAGDLRLDWMEAGNLGDALDVFSRQPDIDLVLLDLNLPDIDGLEVFARLRRHPRTAAIPCVALSADATAARIASIRAEGFTDYWTKPIDVMRLLAGLDRLVADSPTASSAR